MSYPAAYDGSTRFFDYVTGPEVGIPSFFSGGKRKWRLSKHHAFHYTCYVPRKDFIQAYDGRPMRPGHVEAPLADPGKPARRLLPPKLTAAQLRRLARLADDPSVGLIAFPLILQGSALNCQPKSENDRRSHLMVIVLNKRTGAVEVFDDKLPHISEKFGLLFLIRSEFKKWVLPKLQTLMPADAPPLTFAIPRFNERHYARLLETLADHGYPADNYAAHAAFTANYLAERVADPGAGQRTVHDRAVGAAAAAFLARYEALRATQPRPAPCPAKGALLNPETLRCVKGDGPVGRALQGVRRPRQRNAPVPAHPPIRLHEHLLDTDRSDYFEGREVGDNTPAAMSYLRALYGGIATIGRYDFAWDSVKLKAPRDFARVWEAGLKASATRFIVFSVLLVSDTIRESHANALIYDKESRELERFEPNGAGYKSYNQAGLDAALVAFFGERIGAYIEPAGFCPIGIQKLENNEKNAGAKDIGGNCAVWSLYFMELRLSNPSLSRKDVLAAAIRGIKQRGSFMMFINGYHRHVLQAMRGA